MSWNNIKSNILKGVGELSIVLLILGAVVVVTYIYNKNKFDISSPVEGNVIDSLATKNDSLAVEIKQLDSVRNAKVVEVESLDNDSTLKLFYQLIGK